MRVEQQREGRKLCTINVSQAYLCCRYAGNVYVFSAFVLRDRIYFSCNHIRNLPYESMSLRVVVVYNVDDEIDDRP